MSTLIVTEDGTRRNNIEIDERKLFCTMYSLPGELTVIIYDGGEMLRRIYKNKYRCEKWDYPLQHDLYPNSFLHIFKGILQ